MSDMSDLPSYMEFRPSLGQRSSFRNSVLFRNLDNDFDALAERGEKVEEAEEAEEYIKTYLRLRPFSTKDKEDETLTVKDDKTVIANYVAPGGGLRGGKRNMQRMEFHFSKVLDGKTLQEEVFQEVMNPLLSKFELGENCLIFSYGATNSGKTYTMRGSGTKYGIVPRTLYYIFERYFGKIYAVGDIQPFRHESTRQLTRQEQSSILERKRLLLAKGNDPVEMRQKEKRVSVLSRASVAHGKASRRASLSSNNNINIAASMTSLSDLSSHCGDVNFIGGGAGGAEEFINAISSQSQLSSPGHPNILYGMWVSFVEIYNEKCYDLYAAKRQEVKLVAERGSNSYFKDLTELPVFNEEEAYLLYVAGAKKLEVSSTKANDKSSRSHSFFCIRVVELGKTDNTVFPLRVHKITFCDLAGNERVCQTENTGGQLRESAKINNSLLSLLKVIRLIRDKQNLGEAFLEKIPFRESKLTRIFQGYFTSLTHITMIVNVNPSPKMSQSTMQTLSNSAIANNIVAYKPSRKQSVMMEHVTFNGSFLHGSDLEDLEELPEEEEEDVDMKTLPESKHSVSPQTKTIKSKQVPPNGLCYDNRLNVNGYQENLILEMENLINSLRGELAKKDQTISELQIKVDTIEAEVREEMLSRMEIEVHSVRSMEKESFRRRLEASETRASQLQSRFSEIKKCVTVGTQTEL